MIQKYLGDGPKLVRELFRVADDMSPSIVFIDEIDAVGTKRCVRCGATAVCRCNSVSCARVLWVCVGHLGLSLCLSPRYDSHSGGEKEIQRTMLELLNQLDGFDERGDVKVRCR